MQKVPVALSLLTLWTAVAASPALGENAAAAAAPDNPRLTIYVSKLGNDSDGSSWANAFTTIQAALGAVPDDRGGVRIAVRPDTYFEAMLFPVHQGAAGAYNEL